ncbi:hypothetical protein NQZ79_g2580 [Umbelopsis isabellina]|nr:hypothetical protein NQZ79_g2580 [Umbelopsis isabellina]
MVRYSPLGRLSSNSHTPRIAIIAVFTLLAVLSIVSLLALRGTDISARLHLFSSPPAEPEKVGATPAICPATGPNNHFEQQYGHELLQRSIAHEGSNRRLREKIAKAQRGEDIRMAVVGGSVSAGHTLNDWRNIYFYRFLDWWNQQFPDGHHEIFQGAVPATDSGYYAYCFDKHIPKDVDIVFVEFSLNDASALPCELAKQGSIVQAKMMESLVRNLLRLPRKPAVIMTSVFSYNVNEYLDGQESHLPISNYYDLPHISMKNALFDHLNRHPDDLRDKLYNDGHHLSEWGHQLLSDLVSHYVERQICAMSDTVQPPLLDNYSYNESIPKYDMFTHRWQQNEFRELEPYCHTFSDQSYRPKEVDGWRFWNWNNEKFYIVADEPGATVTFEVEANQGVVYLYLLRSANYNLGNIWCWIGDDREKGRELEGYWDKWYSVGVMTPVAEGLSQGQHLLHCELMNKTSHPEGGTHFRILAVASG